MKKFVQGWIFRRFKNQIVEFGWMMARQAIAEKIRRKEVKGIISDIDEHNAARIIVKILRDEPLDPTEKVFLKVTGAELLMNSGKLFDLIKEKIR